MAPVRAAIDLILQGHDPYPALVVDRAWEMIAANRAVSLLTADVAPHLLEPPVNVLRVSLHPEGVAPRIANLAEWRGHLLDRLRRQIALTGDPALVALLAELETYPAPPAPAHDPGQAIAVPLRLHGPAGRARLHLDGRHLRDRGRGHRQRARDRVVLPGRRRDRRRGARARRTPTSDVIDTPPSAVQSGPESTPNGGPDVPAHRPEARRDRHRRQRRRLPRRRRPARGSARPLAGAAARHRRVPAAVLRRRLDRRLAAAGLVHRRRWR